MAYFPFFMDLEGQPGLLVGGGRTALEKARRILDYGPRLTVVAPEVREEFKLLPRVTVLPRAFAPEDVTGDLAFVVAATDRPQVNRAAARLCRERRVPVNVVDVPEECTFLFPSLVRRGPLSVGISTSGASPSAAISLRRQIEALLPEAVEEILDWLRAQREPILRRVREEPVRKALFKALFEESFRLERPLTGEETRRLLEQLEQEAGK